MDNPAKGKPLSNIPSQDPALESFRDDVIEGGHEEILDNEERGCGHLDHNAAYVRSDVEALSIPDGDIPRFVTLDHPIEYREYGGRGSILPGWKPFPGVEFGMAYRGDGYTTTPIGAIEAHYARLEDLRLDGDHYGEMRVARSTDLLMSVGKSHWPTPESYIGECRERGLNLKVPASPSRDPPVVTPFVTRCWVIHPNGVEEGRAGIIGYGVLTRCVFTAGKNATADDPDIPEYAAEWAAAGRVDLATPGEAVPAEEESEPEPDASITDFGGADGNAEELQTQSARDRGDDELPESEDTLFWEEYDIPFDFATAANNRRSQLSKGSTGTGETEETVRHLYVLESFSEGRLSRDADRFLCQGEGEWPDRPSEAAEQPSRITCRNCLSLMERWEVEEGGSA